MNDLIKISTQTYPYSFHSLRNDYPNTSFPLDLSSIDLSDFDAAIVVTAPEPIYNSETHHLVKDLQPQLIDDVWTIGWSVEPLPEPAPSPNWTGFNAALTTNQAKISYDLALVSVNPTLAGKLDLAYLMITSHGMENFNQLFPLYCQTAGVIQDHRDEWADLAETNNLPLDFVNTIRGT
jgi:hypothetical protein